MPSRITRFSPSTKFATPANPLLQSSPWTSDDLRTRARESVAAAVSRVDKRAMDALCKKLSYIDGDYREQATFDALATAARDCGMAKPMFYLAIPPALFDDVVAGLKRVKLNDDGRVVVEKPFGRDLDSAVELNASLYSRSEDGPELLDGFHAMVQYGVLFPLQGLGYLSQGGSSEITGGNPGLKTAQTLRVILGVVF